MFQKPIYYYLIKLQYLGYRYHGWQKQPKLKTLHLMVDKTLKYILEGQSFKTLAAGRTDAMVSAEETAIELFLKEEPIQDKDEFLTLFNKNLPQDIRALSISEVNENFNVIQDSKEKEYHYLFSYGEKNHPFCAPIMTNVLDDLNIELMKEGAKLFQGKHNFKKFCYKASETGVYEREVTLCELVENDIYSSSFFPKKSYLLKVRSEGFGRNQVRMMMGALLDLGRNRISMEDIKKSLENTGGSTTGYIAPASGLILHSTEFM